MIATNNVHQPSTLNRVLGIPCIVENVESACSAHLPALDCVLDESHLTNILYSPTDADLNNIQNESMLP